MKTAAILIFFITAASSAQAFDENYYEIDSVEVHEMKAETLSRRAFAAQMIGSGICKQSGQSGQNRLFFKVPKQQNGSITGEQLGAEILAPLDVVDMALDKVINMGRKVWNIVENGKPVVNMRTDVATALPAGAKCWSDLGEWQAPRTRKYSVIYRNLYGMEVVKFLYRVIYVAGGSVDGKGRYIAYAALEPYDVSVAWGFNFSSVGAVSAVYNVGTRSNPVAAMIMDMKYTIKTPLKQVRASQSFSINGLGQFQIID